jgi:protein-S-isoprenylcysteine O-methyltransferase Ste14
MKHLILKAWLSLLLLPIAMGLILFCTAGTLHYWQAWDCLAAFTGGSALVTAYLVRHDPALLERRMRGGPTAEKEPRQRIIMSFTTAGFLAHMVVPALDHRFGWSAMPLWVPIAGDVLILIGLYIVYLVFRENTFTAATIQVAENQKVISTGPYAIVRHPMYAGALLYLLAMPIALGSWWGLVAFAATFPFLIWRIFEEEQLLSRQLPGYTDYCARVRWRLLPGVF